MDRFKFVCFVIVTAIAAVSLFENNRLLSKYIDAMDKLAVAMSKQCQEKE